MPFQQKLPPPVLLLSSIVETVVMIYLLVEATNTGDEVQALIVTAILHHPVVLFLILLYLAVFSLVIWLVIIFCQDFVKRLISILPERFNPLIRGKEFIETKPTIETYCEVYDTNVPWYRRKQIIWRETKAFEFVHWVDCTDPNINLENPSLVNFKIDFADDETERAYQNHVQQMINELPEYCQNAERMIKTIKKINGKEHNSLLFKDNESCLVNPSVHISCFICWIPNLSLIHI